MAKETAKTKVEAKKPAATAVQAPPALSLLERLSKKILLGMNIIFLVFGVTLIGVGGYALGVKSFVITGVTLPAGLVTIGVFVVLLSFAGCFGAWKENRPLLAIYAIILGLLIICLLGVGAAIYAKRDEADSYIAQGWKKSSPDVRTNLQNDFICCGLYSFNDTYRVDPCPTLKSVTQRQSCLKVLSNSFRASLVSMGGIGIAFAFIMGFGLAFSIVLMRSVKHQRFQFDEPASSSAVASKV